MYGTYRDAKFKEAALGTPESERWHYWNGNSSVSAELYRTIGGFDPAYRLYGWEDVDLGKMIADAGGKIIISDAVETKHYAEATTTAVRETRLWYSLFVIIAGLIVFIRWRYGWILSFSGVLSTDECSCHERAY